MTSAVRAEHLLEPQDVRLLALLQRNGRLTNLELAAEAGMSASQCSRRRKSLEDAGIIADYCTRLNAHRLGFSITAFVHVVLREHSSEIATRFCRLVSSRAEIQSCHVVTGAADYVLRIICRDLPALHVLLADHLLGDPAVSQVRSSVALEAIKDSVTVPLLQPSPLHGGTGSRR